VLLKLPLAAVALLAVLAAAASARSDSASSATTTSRTVTVGKGVVQSTVSGSGNLEATTQQDLTFTRTGTVTKVYVKAGDHVDAGDVLARLDPSDSSLAVRYLRAPFSGTIAEADVAVGDTVTGTKTTDSTSGSTTSSTGDATTAFTMVKLSRYDLTVSLSESDIGKVKAGQMATVTVDATGDTLSAKVTDVGVLSSSDTTASTTTGSTTTGATTTSSSSSSSAVAYPVTLRLTQSSDALKPGMSASADIVTAQATGLTIPTQALRGSTVTLSSGTTKQVTTGIAGDSTTQIVSGLSAGDKVVITSQAVTATATTTSSSSTGANRQTGGFGGGTGGPPAGGPGGGIGG
jgi:macrolide-specific efflux system membrane fusion protein